MTLINILLGMLNGGLDTAILTNKSDYFDYKDNKRVSNEPIGTRYRIALQGNSLENLDIKVIGADTLDNVTNEALNEGIKKGTYTFVGFEGLNANIYSIDGKQKISATATRIVVKSQVPSEHK